MYLIIEDDFSLADLMMDVIGHPTILVRDFETAMQVINDDSIFLKGIVTDNNFPPAIGERPEPMGVELYRKAKTKRPKVKIVMCSSSDQPKEIPCSDFLSKGHIPMLAEWLGLPC